MLTSRAHPGYGVWSSSPEQTRQSERRVALTVTIAFTLAGIAWVLFSDLLLYTPTRDAALVARLETAKGWLFVGLTALLLYLVSRRSASRMTRAQAAMSAVVDSIGDGVLLLGPDRTIVYANPAAVRMLGCERLPELVGMGAPEFSRFFRVSYPDGWLVPPEEYVSQRVFDEGGPLQYKAVLHPLRGGEIVISSTAAAVRTRAGVPADAVVSVMHDITDSQHLERLRDQFFAAAAHSLKTPVAIIKANVQVLSRAGASPFRESSAAIDRQCNRIDRLVQNLLVLARARSRTLQLHPNSLELAPLVERVTREMATASPQHHLRTEVVAAPRVHADQERLAMAVRNLIDEALRSSLAGSLLTVLLTQHDGIAEIGVRYQPLPAEERTCEAYGEYDDLGISRRTATAIVEAHGGTLREEPGPETTVWIRLPVIEGPDGRT